MILGIPDQVILYNSLSMFPQSYRHYPTYQIRAVVTSILHREVLLYLIITSSSIQSLMDLMYCNVTKRKIIFLFIYILVHILFTLYTTIFTYICHLNRSISKYHSKSSYKQNHYVIILLYYVLNKKSSKVIILINHHIIFK